MAPKNNSALYTILAKRLTNDRYASRTDIETAAFLFGMFLIPVWPFYIWNTPLQSRILASALFPIGGLAVALLLGWLVAQGKLSIVNHAEIHTPPNNPKDNPF